MPKRFLVDCETRRSRRLLDEKTRANHMIKRRDVHYITLHYLVLAAELGGVLERRDTEQLDARRDRRRGVELAQQLLPVYLWVQVQNKQTNK